MTLAALERFYILPDTWMAMGAALVAIVYGRHSTVETMCWLSGDAGPYRIR